MTVCTAAHHGTTWAYRRYKCRCPHLMDRMREGWRTHGGPKDRDQDVDPVAVERACHGDKVRLTLRERDEVVRILTCRGLSARQISQRIGISARTVVRYRQGHVKSIQEAA